MNDIILHRKSHRAIALPEPRTAIQIRKAVGWFPTSQMETYIKRGRVLIAEAGGVI